MKARLRTPAASRRAPPVRIAPAGHPSSRARRPLFHGCQRKETSLSWHPRADVRTSTAPQPVRSTRSGCFTLHINAIWGISLRTIRLARANGAYLRTELPKMPRFFSLCPLCPPVHDPTPNDRSQPGRPHAQHHARHAMPAARHRAASARKRTPASRDSSSSDPSPDRYAPPARSIHGCSHASAWSA